MAFERKAACLWHAFNALDDHSEDKVNKSQLKVLTHNIANTVGLGNHITEILEALDAHKEKDKEVNFLEYLFFLKTELFDRLRNSGEINANADLSGCDDICWYLCSRKYLKRDLKILSDLDAFRVFQLFNVYCDVDASGAVTYPVTCDEEEVGLFARRFCSIIGFDFEQEEFDKIAAQIPKFNFQQLLVLLETQYCKTADNSLISSAVQEIHNEVIGEVIKTGFLSKKGQKITTIKDRWFVLTPHRLSYYTASDEKEMKGELLITNRSSVESLPETPGKAGRCFRFTLHTDNRDLEMTAPDLVTRTKWLTAIKQAIEFCNKPQSYQQVALAKRRAAREKRRAQAREEAERRQKEADEIEEARRRLEEEAEARRKAELRIEEAERKKLEDEEKLRQEKEEQKLKYEEQIKLAAEERDKKEREMLEKMKEDEARLKQTMEEMEAALREKLQAEQKSKEEVTAELAKLQDLKSEQENRIQELETLKKDLEGHLEEEIRAKKDEEIVRAAQARVLKEEMEKREELEKLNQQMDDLLRVEGQKRLDLEEEKAQQEQLLLVEKEKLMSLENERLEIEQELRAAEEKMKAAADAKAKVADAVEEKKGGLSRIKDKLIQIIGSEPRVVDSHRGKGAITLAECQAREKLYSLGRSQESPTTPLLSGDPSPTTPLLSGDPSPSTPIYTGDEPVFPPDESGNHGNES